MFRVWKDGTGGLERNKFIMRLHVFCFVCFFMFLSLQWENRWVFLQLWAIYIPGDDRKWKSYFILQIHLIVNDSSMYFFDLVMFNQSIDLLRQKMTNFSLVMYTRFLKTQSLHKQLQARIHFWVQCPHLKIFSTSDGKNQVPTLHFCFAFSIICYTWMCHNTEVKICCYFKTNRFPLCLFVIWRLKSLSLLFVTFQMCILLFYSCPRESVLKSKIHHKNTNYFVITIKLNITSKQTIFIVSHFQSSHNLVELCKKF